MTKLRALLLSALLAATAASGSIVVVAPQQAQQQSSSDWDTRSTAAGVVYAAGFDENIDGYIAGSFGTRAYLDRGYKLGSGGSIRFDQLAGEADANLSGRWTSDPDSAGLFAGFGEGDTMYVSYRARLSQTFHNNISDWDSNPKQIIIHQGNATCASMELTLVWPISTQTMYTECGGRHMRTEIGSSQHRQDTPYLSQQRWDIDAGGTTRVAGYEAEYPNVTWQPPADQWYEVYLKITIGQLTAGGSVNDSSVEMWVLEDGDSGRQKVLATEMALWYDSNDSDVFNNLTLTPYMTALSVAGDEDSSMWIDELIVSTQPIDPPTMAPSWFVNMADQTWTTVAGTGSRIGDVLPDPLPASNFNPPDGSAITGAWNGGAIEQSRGEFVVSLAGGHLDYAGNEVYVLELRAESPAWNRTRTPTADTSGGTEGDDTIANYGDGQPRSSHTYNRPAAGGGFVYHLGVDAMYGGVGYTSAASYRYDLSQTSDGSWEYLGNPHPTAEGGSGRWLGGSSAYDPVTNAIYSIGQFGSNNRLIRYAIDTDTFTLFNTPFDPGYSWMAICEDIRLLVVGGEQNQYYLNIDDDLSGTTATWSGLNSTGAPARFGLGRNGHCHDPSRAIFAWDGDGANVIRLAIPTTLSNNWTWSTISPDGNNAVTPSSAESNGTFSRFNLIKDMGNGQGALVLLNDIFEATYIYKLPADGM